MRPGTSPPRRPRPRMGVKIGSNPQDPGDSGGRRRIRAPGRTGAQWLPLSQWRTGFQALGAPGQLSEVPSAQQPTSSGPASSGSSRRSLLRLAFTVWPCPHPVTLSAPQASALSAGPLHMLFRTLGTPFASPTAGQLPPRHSRGVGFPGGFSPLDCLSPLGGFPKLLPCSCPRTVTGIHRPPAWAGPWLPVCLVR